MAYLLRDRILRFELKPGERLTETGLAQLLSVSRTPVREALQKLIGDGAPNADLGTVASLRHKRALERARGELAGAREAVAGGLPADFISIGLRGTVQALGEVTGESATEDLLDTIFAKFCIGK